MKLSKLLALYLPYVVIGLLATNLGEAWRLAVGKELGDKIVSLMGTIPAAFANPLPSLHPLDLLVGLCCGAAMRLAVYLKGKNRQEVPSWLGVRLRPVGYSERYRAIYGSKVRGQYHPDQNRTPDDVQPPAGPQECPETKMCW